MDAIESAASNDSGEGVGGQAVDREAEGRRDRFRKRLQAAVAASGLSERALSLKAGLSRVYVSNLLRGPSSPHGAGLHVVEAVARAAGVRPGWLAFGEGEGPGAWEADEDGVAPAPPRAAGVPMTCTLTDLARMAGRSTHVVRGWLDECDVPIYGNGVGRHILVDDLKVRRPEVYRLFERRAEERARAQVAAHDDEDDVA
jgi:transcriptional regulator with XRE-family HTH domain